MRGANKDADREATGQGTAPAKKSRLWTRDLVQILCANCAIYLSFQVLIPVLPLYVAESLGDEAVVGLVVGSLPFTAMLTRPLLGWAIDQYGRKKVLILSALLFGAVGLSYPLAASLFSLLVIRVVQGIGWGGVPPATSSIVADLIPPSRRGEGIAYLSTTQSIAMAVGPALGLFVASGSGYTAAFFASAGFALLGLALSLFVSDRYAPPAEKKKFHLRDLIEGSSIAPSSITALMTFVFGGLTAFIPLDALERDLGNPSVFFVTFAVGLIIVRPITGSISDRQANRGMLLFPGIALIVAALLVLSFTETPWTLATTAVLWAVGFGISQPVLRAMVLDLAPRERWGSANATLASAYDLGIALGALLLGLLASLVGIPAMFALASLAMAPAFVLILSRRQYQV